MKENPRTVNVPLLIYFDKSSTCLFRWLFRKCNEIHKTVFICIRKSRKTPITTGTSFWIEACNHSHVFDNNLNISIYLFSFLFIIHMFPRFSSI